MNVTFDELRLHLDVKQELGTPFRLIPNQEGDTREFLRIRKDDDLSETRNVCVSKVIVQMVHEFEQKLRHRITGIPVDVFSYDLGERLMLGRNNGRLNDALIAWHKERGKQLEQAEVKALFPEAQEMRQLLDAWLVWGLKELEDTSGESSVLASNNHAPGSYQELLAVRSLGDKITAEAQKYGTIVQDINADTARRICMCILWVHGGQENSDYLDRKFRQRWIIHQNEIVHALDGIAGIVGHENMMFFPEGDSAENGAEQQDFRSRKYASPTITKELGEIYASRPDLAHSYCQAIINGGNPAEFRETISADNRFVYFGRQHGYDPVTQIHGLSSREKRARMNDIERLREEVNEEIENRLREFGILCSFEDLYEKRSELHKRWYEVNFSHTHQTATESVHEFLPQGKLGVILLGAAHSRCHEKHKALAEEVDMFREPEGMYIEDFFEGDENHRNTRFISFKPHSLVPFEEEDRRDYQKRVDKERAKKADLEARRREWRRSQGFDF